MSLQVVRFVRETNRYCFSRSLLTGTYKLSQEHLNVDSDEEADEDNDNSEDLDANRGKPRDFDFDADVMQDQRILDTDAVLRFESNSSADHLLSTDDPCETPNFTEGDVQNGSWQFQNPNRIKQKIKRIIRRELNRDDAMSEDEASKVHRRLCLRHYSIGFQLTLLCSDYAAVNVLLISSPSVYWVVVRRCE